MKKYVCALAAAAIIGLSAYPSNADIYQYVDENGVVHFTNVPSGRVAKSAKVHAEYKRTRQDNTLSSAQAARHGNNSGTQNVVSTVYLEIINKACEKFGVDPSLVHAIIKVESAFNPLAVSRKGAMGLMQLMPQTALNMNVKNTFSPDENIEGGVRYLRYLLDKYEGNLSLTLAAYNSGEGSVNRWGTVPPFKETQDYVKKILTLYNGHGRTTFTPRYTIYVGYNPDGTLLLTDNPSNHSDKILRRKMERSL